MDSITVAENGTPLTFRFDDLLRYHGPGFPGGVAHGLKAMQAGFAALSPNAPIERREVTILTAFTGPGGRDAVEAVTRALTDGRYRVERGLGGANVIDAPPGPYLWRFTWRAATVEVTIRPGHVRERFVRLGAKPDRSPAEDAELTTLKAEMAARLVPLPAEEIYAVRWLAETPA